MNKPLRPPLFALWLALATALWPALRAQETPPPPAAPEAPATPPAADEKSAVAADQPAPAAPEETERDSDRDEAEPKLRELGADGAAESNSKARSRSSRSRTYSHSSDGQDEDLPFGSHRVSKGNRSGEVVSFLGSSVVDGETGEAISIFGNTTVNGTAHGEAVSVMGTTTVNGTVMGEAVAVFGNNVINGRVKGDAVVVMGDMRLGPEAVVGGGVTVVGGRLIREPGAQIHGSIEEITFPIFHGFEWLHAYFHKCIKWGRLLWFGENLGWAWLVAGGFLLFYLMLTLIFPRGINRCAAALEEKPGASIVAALLTAVLTPILLIILVMTGIGIALVPVVGTALLIGTLVGKASILAWFGRRVLGAPAEATTGPTLLTVAVGGGIMCLIYCVPVLGIVLYKLLGSLGLGMVVYVVAQSLKREKPAAPAVPPSPPPACAYAAAPAPGFAAVGVAPGAVEPPPAMAGMVPPPPVPPAPVFISALTLPRAGFWIRVAAALLDAILIGIVFGMLSNFWFFRGFGDVPPLWFAVYCTVMWATKGTTIGGIICGLKIVRLDDRPVDWGVAVVRALGGFLSLAVAGLGFIWVAFDNDRQSWHDKIAGTTIVRVPKGTPLL